MFDEKTILARLQNGEDAQKIADEMAAMINKANKMYADELAKAEEAKRAEEKAAIQKKTELQEILDLFADWFNTYYGIDAKGELEADAVLELIESVKEYVDALKGLETMFSVKNATKPVKKIVKPAANADETINDFLKKMGW